MNTKEFEKRLKNKGYEIDRGVLGSVIVSDSETKKATIIFEPDECFIDNTSMSSFFVCPENNKTGNELTSLISLVSSYLVTPLNKRVEQKVKIRVTGKYESKDGTANLSIAMSEYDEDIYVNMDVDDSSFYLDDKFNYSFTHTIFDKSQVKNIMNSHFRGYTYVIEPVEDNSND